MDTRAPRWPKILAAVLAVLVVAVAGGLFALDSFLTGKAREEAAKLGRELGRPVEVGGVAVKLFSGLAVRVTGVRVGPGPGEQEDLVAVERVEVRAALLRALTSRGKAVEVKLAEVSGLRVNVVRFADGQTNLEHLLKALEEKAAKEPKKEPAPAGPPPDLSFLRVDSIALREGRVGFLDKATPGAKELAISHLDLSIKDLRAGKPLEVVLRAAVLAEKPNFELRVATGPLPATLVPVPERVALKVEPIDLAPLSPFVPASVGLQAGRFDADFDARLGAAVAGGDGPTQVKGAIRLLGLRFAGAEGGKALDVTLDADVQADAAAGDVSLDKLLLVLGPASVKGSGKAKGLRSAAPQIAGLEVVASGLDPEKLAAVYPPLQKQLKGMAAGPIGLALRGAGSATDAALVLEVDLTPVRLSVPEVLEKAAGGRFTLGARARLGKQGAPIGFSAALDLAGVDLRPGQSLEKAPGDALKVALAGTFRPLEGKETGNRVEVSELKVDLLADAIAGKAWAELVSAPKAATRFDVTLASDRLDLDRLLWKGKKKEKPPADPKVFAGLAGRSETRIGAIKLKGIDPKNVLAIVQLQEDEVEVQKAELDLLGGHLSAAGTRLKLAHPKEPLVGKLDLKNIDLAQAVALATEKKVLTGRLEALVDVKAAGQTPEQLKQSLTGTLQGKVLDGVFHGKDLVASATGPLAKALPFGLAGKDGQGGTTSLGKELPVGVRFENGEAKLAKPLVIARPDVGLSLTGGMKLDGELNLPGTLTLSPGAVSTLTAGKAKVAQGVPVKLRIAGPATSPGVTDLDFGEAASTIAKGALAGAVGGQLGKLLGGDASKPPEEQVKKKLEDEAANKLKSLFGR